MKKLLLVVLLFINSWSFIFAQDQIIYKYSQNDYVDSILGVNNDTIIYSNFKEIYKVPLSDVEAYFITIRSKENLGKGFYMRERELYNISEKIEYQERNKLRRDTVIHRTHVIKSAIPFKLNGNYEFDLSYEKFNTKKTSFYTNISISVINDLDLWVNQSGGSFPEYLSYHNIYGNSFSVTTAYKYYFIPFKRFKPAGVYIGIAAQPSYTKVYCDYMVFYNESLQYSYRDEGKIIGVNVGGLAGIQFLISSRICLGFEFGFYGSISKFTSEKTVYFNTGHELKDIITKDNFPMSFNISLGYAFN